MKKTALRLLPWIVIFAVLYFFAKTLVVNWNNIDKTAFHFGWLAVVGIALFVLAVVSSGLLWGKILSGLTGQKIPHGEAVRIHSASWLLKYVPGQVGSFINKITWAKSRGISQKSTATSFVYENILTTLASFVVSLPLLVIYSNVAAKNGTIYLSFLLVIPFVIVIYQPVFYKLLNAIFKRLGKKPFRESDFLTTRQLFVYLMLYLIPRLLNAFGFVLVAVSLLHVEPYMYAALGATYVLASIIGLLAIFVPGGIGVREVVIVLFASMYFPVEQAIILSVVARLYATVADIGVAGVYLVLNKGRIKQL